MLQHYHNHNADGLHFLKETSASFQMSSWPSSPLWDGCYLSISAWLIHQSLAASMTDALCALKWHAVNWSKETHVLHSSFLLVLTCAVFCMLKLLTLYKPAMCLLPFVMDLPWHPLAGHEPENVFIDENIFHVAKLTKDFAVSFTFNELIVCGWLFLYQKYIIDFFYFYFFYFFSGSLLQ